MACESIVPSLDVARAYSGIRLILIAAVLPSIVHPGIYAGALRDFKAHVYELTTPLALDNRSETYNTENGVGQRFDSR